MSRRRFLYLPMEGRRNRIAQRFAFPSSDKRRPLGFTSVRVSRGCLRRYFAIVCVHECREDVSFWSTLAFNDAKKERERKSERGRAGDGRIGGVLYAMPNMYTWYGVDKTRDGGASGSKRNIIPTSCQRPKSVLSRAKEIYIVSYKRDCQPDQRTLCGQSAE